jgi:hypothetical protein
MRFTIARASSGLFCVTASANASRRENFGTAAWSAFAARSRRRRGWSLSFSEVAPAFSGGGTRYRSGESVSFMPSFGQGSSTERPLKNVRRAGCDSFLRLAKLTKPPMADSATPGPAGVSTFLLRLNAATMPQ